MRNLKKSLLVTILMLLLILIVSCSKKEERTETEEIIETTKEKIVETVKKQENVNGELNKDIVINEIKVDEKTSYKVVRFGSYNESIGTSNKIDWLIVDKNDKSYLLVSRYIIDCKNYNDEETEVIFENSSLNSWLNNYFLNSAFSTDEIAYMNNVREFGLDGGGKVSLLNISSCRKYFGTEDADKRNYRLSARATSWAKSNWVEVVESDKSEYYMCGSFYLSDNGKTKDKAAWAGQYGRVYTEGQSVKLNKGDGIRPVIVVNKELIEGEQVIQKIEETEIKSEEVETVESTKIENDVVETTAQIVDVDIVYSNVAKEKFKSSNVPSKDKESVELSGWEYGKTPIEWIYVMPNTQIICNNSPNRSTNFSYKMAASSGSKGCYMTIFSRGECLGSDWDGRFYSFEDYTKVRPEEMRFSNKFEELKYGEYNVKELLEKKYNIDQVTAGVVKANGYYINVVYISELDEIIASNQ